MLTESRHPRLSEPEMGNLLASFGNHEGKALLLGTMQPGIIYSSSALHSVLLEKQSPTNKWSFDNKLPTNYVIYSLAPIGLVAAEVTDAQNNRYGYIKTQYGADVGDALAGHLLDFSLQDPVLSLIDYFGATSSSSVVDQERNHKKRAPITRLRIFWDLATRQLPVREVDVATSLGEKVTYISDHIESFSGNQIIEYDSRKADAPYSSFYIPANFEYKASKSSLYTTAITEVLKRYPDQIIDIDLVTAEALKLNPDLEPDKLFERVGDTLRRFNQRKLISRRSFTRLSQSEINLSSTQRTRLITLIEILDQFSTLDWQFMEEGRLKLQSIISNPEQVSFLMLKARSASSQSHDSSREDLQNWIKIAVESQQTTTRNIQLFLAEKYAKRISTNTILKAMKGLISSDKINIVSERTSHTYSSGSN